jgi:hypothetical protein
MAVVSAESPPIVADAGLGRAGLSSSVHRLAAGDGRYAARHFLQTHLISTKLIKHDAFSL